MATINSLSPELLEQIFDYAVGDSDKFKYSKLSPTSEIFDTRPSTKSLLLVNKTFYATAQRLHNRHKHLIIRQENGDGDSERSMNFIAALLHDPSKRDILRSIRTLTVTCGLKRRSELLDSSTYEQNIEQLGRLVSKIPKLLTLTFKGDLPIPLTLLETLEKHQPQCHLHIEDWHRTRADMDHNDVTEIALANSPNLRSITTELWGDGNTRLDLRKFTLKRIVSQSPHLESVEIKEGTFGCFWRSYSPQERVEMEQLGAFFTTSKPSPNNIKGLKSRGGDHVKLLEDVTEMTKLESLDLGWSPNFDFFSSRSTSEVFQSSRLRFENLKHLAVEMGHWYDPRTFLPETYLRDFLAVCPPLESLKITDRRGRVDLSIILDNHGHSLRKLHLHESERTEIDGIPSDCNFLSLEEIRDVRKSCPELQEFAVDMERNSGRDSTKKILEEVAQFEKVHTLTLHFPLGLVKMASSPAPPKGPLLLEFRDPVPSDYVAVDPFNCRQAHSWLENTYSFLQHQRRKNNFLPFKELRVNLGEWERQPPMGLPASWECLEGRNKRCFILTGSETDGYSDKVEIRTLRLMDMFEEKSVKEEREVRTVVGWRGL
jgi:hypothetical protein